MTTNLYKHLAKPAVIAVLGASLVMPVFSLHADDGHQTHEAKKKGMEHMQMKEDHHGKGGMMEMHMKMKAKMKACMQEKLARDSETDPDTLKEKMLGHMDTCMDGMMEAKMTKMKVGKHGKSDHKKDDGEKHQH